MFCQQNILNETNRRRPKFIEISMSKFEYFGNLRSLHYNIKEIAGLMHTDFIAFVGFGEKLNNCKWEFYLGY